LPTSSFSRLAVYDLETYAQGILKGQFNNSLVLDNVLQTEKITLGDMIATSGENANLPAGLRIGKISEIKKREAEVFQQGMVEPLLNYKDLEYVFIAKFEI
jgi:rod shape-determining protein MreC